MIKAEEKTPINLVPVPHSAFEPGRCASFGVRQPFFLRTETSSPANLLSITRSCKLQRLSMLCKYVTMTYQKLEVQCVRVLLSEKVHFHWNVH